jgi:hypothetical protein
VSRTEYRHRCIEGSAIRAYGMAGVAVEAGMEIGYVVRDGKRLIADPPWEANDCGSCILPGAAGTGI